MKNLICEIFGHKLYEGTLTTSFFWKLKDSEWEREITSSKHTMCSRCGELMPPYPTIKYGQSDATVLYPQMEAKKEG